MSLYTTVARQLASAVCAGRVERVEDVVASIAWLLDDDSDWVDRLGRHLWEALHDGRVMCNRRGLSHFLRGSTLFHTIWITQRPRIRRYPLQSPAAPLQRIACDIPTLADPPALARWLGIGLARLDSLAGDWRQRNPCSDDRHHHYHYRLIDKPSGGIRLLEIPKSRLREIQRQIHLGILRHVPLHAACHGFRRQHSIRDYALPHCDRSLVMHFDLSQFFNSIGSRRIHGLFTALGYGPSVASALSAICTHRTASNIIHRLPDLDWSARRALATPHLPQGSPASPALANLCAFRLDRRYAGLAQSLGLQYTRYADDLAFSGEQMRDAQLQRLHALVGAIALEEGFALNMRKSRFMRRNVAQRLAGVTVNAHPNPSRPEYDTLKAILHNCARDGFAAQNRAGIADFRLHLRGRIAHVMHLNPKRGQRLLDAFLAIEPAS